jgi:hypothetical protein
MRRATKSKDGILRFSVNIQFRLDRDWLIAYVAFQMGQTRFCQSHTRTTLWDQIVGDLKDCGQMMFYDWQQHIAPSRLVFIKKRATEIVDRLFPELS